MLYPISGITYLRTIVSVHTFVVPKMGCRSKKIKEMWLKKVIDTYIDDERIKACAEKATWLGNDETHYVRRWKNKDINDLKELIGLTRSWIVTDIKTKRYLKSMKKDKNK